MHDRNVLSHTRCASLVTYERQKMNPNNNSAPNRRPHNHSILTGSFLLHSTRRFKIEQMVCRTIEPIHKNKMEQNDIAIPPFHMTNFKPVL